jgi:hypothetical protein
MEGYLANEKESGPEAHVLVTTLSDLVNAVEEAIQDGEEYIVVRTMLNLIDSGSVRFHNT